MVEKHEFELGDEPIRVEVRRPVGVRLSVHLTADELDALQGIADERGELVTGVAHVAIAEFIKRQRRPRAKAGT